MSEPSVAFQTLEESMENTETVILACSGLLLLLQLSLQFIYFLDKTKQLLTFSCSLLVCSI